MSWVGFEDAFDAAAETAETVDDEIAAEGDSLQPADDQQVNSNQQVDNNYREQVSLVDNSSSSAPPDDVMPPPPSDKDVITWRSEEQASEREPVAVDAAAETAGDNDDVAMATHDAESVKETTPAENEEQEPVTRSESRGAADAVEGTETVDPFDVSNVVTAMSSGKPIFEVLSSEEDRSSAAAVAKQQVTRKTAEELSLIHI